MQMILQKIQSAKIVLVLLQPMRKDSSSYRLHSKRRNDLLTCGNELLTCGNELLTCGNELLTRGHSFLSCGKEIKKLLRKQFYVPSRTPYSSARKALQLSNTKSSYPCIYG